MYIPDRKITGSSSTSLDVLINDMDIYNSKYLHLFMQLPSVSTYTVTRFEERIDLISADIFNGELYTDLLLIYNNMSVKDLKLGAKLKVFSLNDVKQLFLRLDDIKNRL